MGKNPPEGFCKLEGGDQDNNSNCYIPLNAFICKSFTDVKEDIHSWVLNDMCETLENEKENEDASK